MCCDTGPILSLGEWMFAAGAAQARNNTASFMVGRGCQRATSTTGNVTTHASLVAQLRVVRLHRELLFIGHGELLLMRRQTWIGELVVRQSECSGRVGTVCEWHKTPGGLLLLSCGWLVNVVGCQGNGGGGQHRRAHRGVVLRPAEGPELILGVCEVAVSAVRARAGGLDVSTHLGLVEFLPTSQGLGRELFGSVVNHVCKGVFIARGAIGGKEEGTHMESALREAKPITGL